ncbi:urease accessory protein UreF [Actinomadura xylanilytica]|uniref:urease accessory protein UreF n=1 Tax=Actinomadura xylanilytica TaxID=887459 RepID=UPI00255AB7F2|nr:urease accessory UreF family protein [Actinomadura xylanilytica]MDL4775849.1 urease accessory UreF family protein [Actinomadura xylanilytica]
MSGPGRTGGAEPVSGPGRADGHGPLLAQLQLTDSAFPSGLYTLSHGLEASAASGPEEIAAVVADLLRHSAGPGDATALAQAHRAVRRDDWAAVAAVDRRLHAVKLNRELRRASVRTGRQVLETAAVVFGGPELETLAALVRQGAALGNHAVVVGVVYAGQEVPADDAVVGDLFAFALSCTTAAVRLGRIDFRQAQAVLRGLAPVIEEAARAALARESPGDIGGTVPLADVLSAVHERAPARLFTT